MEACNVAVSSPTARSLAILRERGYRCQVVEYFVPYTKVRRDLFGFIDIMAVRDGETLAVQTTSGAHVAERINKITVDKAAELADVRKAGWAVHVHGWSKNSKGRWVLREVDIS